MSLDPALRTRIETLLAANPAVLFMKGSPQMPQCGFSAKAVAALEAIGAEYAHVDVLADDAIREGIKVYGDWPTIPQLYIGNELIGGSDIIAQMLGSGELSDAFGLPPPDRTPPDITITPAALDMLRSSIDQAGQEVALTIEIDARFRTRLHLAAPDASAISQTLHGIAVQCDLASARRANGLTIDFADDLRGRGLVIDNPNAPKPVHTLTPAEANTRAQAGALTIVDVRPPEERALAALPLAVRVFDDEGEAALRALPKDTALAFLCHRGGRSQQAAERFAALGFTQVYNIEGGIEAWAQQVDAAIAQY